MANISTVDCVDGRTDYPQSVLGLVSDTISDAFGPDDEHILFLQDLFPRGDADQARAKRFWLHEDIGNLYSEERDVSNCFRRAFSNHQAVQYIERYQYTWKYFQLLLPKYSVEDLFDQLLMVYRYDTLKSKGVTRQRLRYHKKIDASVLGAMKVMFEACNGLLSYKTFDRQLKMFVFLRFAIVTILDKWYMDVTDISIKQEELISIIIGQPSERKIWRSLLTACLVVMDTKEYGKTLVDATAKCDCNWYVTVNFDFPTLEEAESEALSFIVDNCTTMFQRENFSAQQFSLMKWMCVSNFEQSDHRVSKNKSGDKKTLDEQARMLVDDLSLLSEFSFDFLLEENNTDNDSMSTSDDSMHKRTTNRKRKRTLREDEESDRKRQRVEGFVGKVYSPGFNIGGKVFESIYGCTGDREASVVAQNETVVDNSDNSTFYRCISLIESKFKLSSGERKTDILKSLLAFCNERIS